MCNRYTAPDEAAIERYWHFGRDNQWRGSGVFPRSPGPFIRRTRDDTGYSRELVVGQSGLIPWFAKEAKLAYSTNNARSEELAAKASFKAPWARGQWCIIYA
jgi:putative SOS response-associated peptidase YedK